MQQHKTGTSTSSHTTLTVISSS